MVSKKETVAKASKGFIRDYYTQPSAVFNQERLHQDIQGLLPVFDREKALATIRDDPTVIGAITTLVDMAVKRGGRVEGVHKKSNLETAEGVLKKLRFNRLLRQVFFNLFTYKNAFIEIVKDGNDKPKELHILETTKMEPIASEYGEILGYIERVPQLNEKDQPTWTPDLVTHIAATKLTTSIWGEIDLQSVYTCVLIKLYIKEFIGWLFGTNQFRTFYNIKEASDEQVKEFISYLKRSEEDLKFPLIAEGEIVHKLIRDFKDGTEMIAVLDRCDKEILTLLQVPPVLLGSPGDSNRSNSDAQFESLFTHIEAMQEVVEDALEFDLFPKLGFDKITYQFNPISRFNTEKMLVNAERMVNMGFKFKVVEEFLKIEGFPIEGTLFDKEKQDVKKSMDMFPSRQGKSEGDANEKIGTGEEGTTREDQLVKKSFNNDSFDLRRWKPKSKDFAKYPYSY